MAALVLNQDQSTGTMTLAQKVTSRLGSLVVAGIWILVLLIFLVPSLLDNSADLGSLLLVLLFLGLPTASSIANGLISTTVTIDPTNRVITSLRRLLVLPISATTMGFGDIAGLDLQRQGASRSNPSGLYRLSAVGRDGRRMVLNWNGSQGEMNDQAQRISSVTGAPAVLPTSRAPQTMVQMPRFGPVGGTAPADAGETTSSSPLPGMNELSQTEPPQISPPAGAGQMTDATPQPTSAPLPVAPPSAPLPSYSPPPMPPMTAMGSDIGTPIQPSFMPPVMQQPTPPIGTPYGMDSSPSMDAGAPASVDMDSLSEGELNQRVQSDPMDSDARYALAGRYLARGLADRAIPLYQEASRIDPSNAGVQNDLGIAQQMRGKKADAEASYRRASALDPFSSVPHLNLALLLRDSKRAAEASQEFLLARRNAQGDDETRAAEAGSTGAKLPPQLWRS